MPTKVLTIDLATSHLLELQAFLEQAHTAARDGNLDWGACDFTVKLEFTRTQPSQSFAALEALIESQDRIYGLPVQKKITTEESMNA
jgi:hypothetical protein